jgi:hypothetical protein
MSSPASTSFRINKPLKVADSLQPHYLEAAEVNVEVPFDGDNYIHMTQGIPARNIGSNGIVGNLTILEFERRKNYSLQFVANHGCRDLWSDMNCGVR